MDGPAALHTFLPLRWLLANDSFVPDVAIERWRGELDWWVFADGELGMASVEVSGSRSATSWGSGVVLAVLEARLEATARDVQMEVVAPFETTPSAAAPDAAAESTSAAATPTLGSVAP
jgi:hypothetical protein